MNFPKQKAEQLVSDFGSRELALKCIDHILLAGLTPLQRVFHLQVRLEIKNIPEKAKREHTPPYQRIIKLGYLLEKGCYNKDQLRDEIYERIGTPVSNSTIEKDLRYIREDLGISVKYNKTSGVYYLAGEKSVKQAVMDEIFGTAANS